MCLPHSLMSTFASSPVNVYLQKRRVFAKLANTANTNFRPLGICSICSRNSLVFASKRQVFATAMGAPAGAAGPRLGSFRCHSHAAGCHPYTQTHTDRAACTKGKAGACRLQRAGSGDEGEEIEGERRLEGDEHHEQADRPLAFSFRYPCGHTSSKPPHATSCDLICVVRPCPNP